MDIFDIIVNFIIQKLKSKHISLKEYTNCGKLTEKNQVYFFCVLRERKEKETKYFAPKSFANGTLCQEYVESYVAYVSVESPTSAGILTNKDKRIFFYDGLSTGKSFSEALILASTNPQYDKRLFIDLPV